jgi:23S rRNA pseudouridine2605 synthase
MDDEQVAARSSPLALTDHFLYNHLCSSGALALKIRVKQQVVNAHIHGSAQMRLNAYIARSGIASRRKADKLIQEGKVIVNGRTGQLNDDVSEQDTVVVSGKVIRAETLHYILLNKPTGFVTTLDDPQGRPKVTDLVKISERVVPVGRLDMDTTGALLLTNDGDLAHRLMHPSFEINKVYEAEVEETITGEKLNKLSSGVKIDDQMTSPAGAKQIGPNKIELTIHEGRKHQVKKMLAVVGLPVKRLHRSHYGPLSLHGLKLGQWRELSSKELELLK